MIVSGEACAPLIESLLLALVDNKRAVTLEANVLPGRINWSFRVHIDDMGKIVGIEGVHLRAIQLVLELMGKAAGEEWHGLAIDPHGVERAVHPAAPTPETHSTAADCKLIENLLAAMGIKATVTASGGVKDGFIFEIRGLGVQDHSALLDEHEAIYRRNQRSRDPINLLGALGTLFRSIGRRQGVRYRVKVPIV